MSIERDHGFIVFRCDECDETLDTGEHDFADAKDVMRSNDWRTFMDEDGDWRNVCGECRDKGIR